MTIDRQLKGLEKRYWDAIQVKDVDAAMRLSDSECIVVGAQGVGSIDRDRLGEMLKAASYELTHYEIDDEHFQLRKLTEDVVVVAYRVREDLVVDGKAESLEAYDASVWVHRADGWHCALHTETLKGDPFGRNDVDRIAT
jgi:hypothetical protein